MIKKILSITVMTALLLNLGFASAFAATTNEQCITVDSGKMGVLASQLKSIDCSDANKVNATLSAFSTNTMKSASAVLGASIKNQGDTKIKFESKKTVKLNETTTVTFENVSDIGVVTIIQPEKQLKNDLSSIAAVKGISAAAASTVTKSGTYKFSSYSIMGTTIFAVTIKYGFQITNGIVSCTEGKGWIAPGFLSMWTGNIWTDKNPTNVNSYGTACWTMPIAKIFGINVNLQSINYDCKVKCNSAGTITTSASYVWN